jgi:hypothetical protein
MLSHAQRALNTYTRSEVSEVVLATVANVTLYTVPSTLARVDLVRFGAKDLVKFRLTQLWARDKNWLTAQGTNFAIWSRIGRQVIAVVPAKAAASSVTLVGPTLLADLTATTDVLNVRDDQLTTLTEILEALMTLRLRLFPAFQSVMERLGKKFSLEPVKMISEGIHPTDSSAVTIGVAPGDIPDLDKQTMKVEMQRPQ